MTNTNYLIKEPDFNTCCDYGRWNGEAAKAVRRAKAEGKTIKKYEIKFVWYEIKIDQKGWKTRNPKSGIVIGSSKAI